MGLNGFIIGIILFIATLVCLITGLVLKASNDTDSSAHNAGNILCFIALGIFILITLLFVFVMVTYFK